MAEDRSPPPTAEQVEQRLRDLKQLYELGQALREVRFGSSVEADRVREGRGPEESTARNSPPVRE